MLRRFLWDLFVELEADGDVPYMNGIGGAAASSTLDDWAKDEEVHEDIDPEEGGWDLDPGGTEAQLDAEEFTDAAEANDELGTGANPHRQVNQNA